MSRVRWLAVEAEMGVRVINREPEIRGLILATLSGQHPLFLGPPGVAKTYTIKMLVDYLGASYFTHLMGKFTTPDEVFGPWDIQAMKNSQYIRKTEGRLPSVKIAVLGEIFKANTAINNSFLKLMQERLFDNDGEKVCPLIMLVGASNELPDEGEGLAAVYDRFLLRYFSTNLDPSNGDFMDMLGLVDQGRMVDRVDEEMLAEDIAEVAAMPLSQEAKESVQMVAIKLREAGIINSTRRFKQMTTVMAADAWLRGENVTDSESVIVGEHILWEKPDQIREVRQIVRSCVNPILARCNEVKSIINEQLAKVSPSTPSTDTLQYIQEIKALREDLIRMNSSVKVVAQTVTWIDAKVTELIQGMVA